MRPARAAHVTVLNLLEPLPGEYGGCRPHASRALSQCSPVWSLGRRRLANSPLSGSLTSVSCAGSGDRSGGWWQYLGPLIRRGAVGVHHKLLGALVDGLQRRARRDVDDPAGGNYMALGRLTEVHCEAPREDDEGLLLLGVHVAAASCAGLVTPHVSPSVLEVHRSLQLGNVPRWLARLVRTGCPLKLLRQHDGERHAIDDTEGRRRRLRPTGPPCLAARIPRSVACGFAQLDAGEITS